MGYLTAKQFSERWGISERRIIKLCKEERISGAIKNGMVWEIPEETLKPSDRRSNIYKYINTQKRIMIVNIKEELKEYYSSKFDYIEVNEQETVNLDFIQNVSFNADIKSGDKTYYSIICWDDERREMFGDFISELLDFDIRGH